MDLLTIVTIVSVCIVAALPFAHMYVRHKAHLKGYVEGHTDCRQILGKEIFHLSQEILMLRRAIELKEEENDVD